MKFSVYPIMWCGQNNLSPETILRENKISYTWMPPQGQSAGALEINITPEQLACLVEDERVDILISGDLLAFDFAGKKFRQR